MCSACHGFHPRVATNRSVFAARYCAKCNERHPAKEVSWVLLFIKQYVYNCWQFFWIFFDYTFLSRVTFGLKLVILDLSTSAMYVKMVWCTKSRNGALVMYKLFNNIKYDLFMWKPNQVIPCFVYFLGITQTSPKCSPCLCVSHIRTTSTLVRVFRVMQCFNHQCNVITNVIS